MDTALSKGTPANGGLSTKTAPELEGQTLLSLVAGGDTSNLKPEQKLAYYKARCDVAGLDPRAQPFAFIKLQGKEVLYCLKSGTEQLASKHGIVCEVVDQRTEAGVRTVTVRSRSKDGRQTDEIGCVSVEGLKGDALCNAFMKAVTKAKRRAVLSICGLGVMDETEIETIPGAFTPEAYGAPKDGDPKPVFDAHASAHAAAIQQKPVVPVPKEEANGWAGLLTGVESPKAGLWKVTGFDGTAFATTVPECAATAKTAAAQKTEVRIKFHKNTKGVFIMDSIDPAGEEVANG